MAKTVFRSETIEFLDGSSSELKSLSIKNMKKFQSKFDELQKADGQTAIDALDGLLDLALICLAGTDPEKAADRDWAEDAIDLETMYKVIEVCSGVKLNDPNLVQQVAETLMQ